MSALCEGRTADAVAQSHNWTEVEPDNAHAWLTRARVALVLENAEEFLAAKDRAKALGTPLAELDVLQTCAQAWTDRATLVEPRLRQAFRTRIGPEPEVTIALARIAMATFQFGLAEQTLERWRTLMPGDARPYLWHADLARRNDADASILLDDYQNALQRDPNAAAAQLGLAELHHTQGEDTLAWDQYQNYLKQKPDDALAHQGAARCALGLARPADARLHLDRALELSPDDPEILRDRALIDIQTGHPDLALPRLLHAVAKDPFHLQAQTALAQTLHRLGQPARARAVQTIVDRLRADEERLTQLRRNLVQDPNNIDLRYQIAEWLQLHQRPREAQLWAERILTLQPRHAPTHRLLTLIFRAQNDPGRANFHELQARESEQR